MREKSWHGGAAVTTIRAFPSGSAFFTAAATAAGSSEVRSPRCRSHGSLSLVSLMQASSISHANAARGLPWVCSRIRPNAVEEGQEDVVDLPPPAFHGRPDSDGISPTVGYLAPGV